MRASILALAVVTAAATAAAAVEQIGQGGRAVRTQRGNTSNSLNPTSPNYVPPAATSPYTRPIVTPRGTYYPNQRKR